MKNGTIIGITDEVFRVDYGEEKIVEYLWCLKEQKKKKSSEEDGEERQEFFASDTKHSFAKTVHKSQGSEYEYVIFYLPRNLTNFLNINLLYTAITRTKKKIWIVTDRDTLDLASMRYLQKRYERLSERLKEMELPDETIITNKTKQEIFPDEFDVGITNDDIWDDDFVDDTDELDRYYD